MAAQRTAVVFGGTGFVGRSLVRRWLRDGARVFVPSRSERGLDALRRHAAGPGDLVPLVLDISNPDGMEAVRAALADAGGVDYAVASLAGWWEGDRLVDLSPALWQDLLQSHLTAHFLAAKAAVVNLREDAGPNGPAFVTLNGIAALQPEAHSGPISVTGAAQAMLLDVLRAENDRPRARFHEVCVVNPIVGDGEAATAAEPVVEIGHVVDETVALTTGGHESTRRLTLGSIPEEGVTP